MTQCPPNDSLDSLYPVGFLIYQGPSKSVQPGRTPMTGVIIHVPQKCTSFLRCMIFFYKLHNILKVARYIFFQVNRYFESCMIFCEVESILFWYALWETSWERKAFKFIMLCLCSSAMTKDDFLVIFFGTINKH